MNENIKEMGSVIADNLIMNGNLYVNKTYEDIGNSIADILYAAGYRKQSETVVVLPCIKPFNNGNYGIVYEVLEWDNANGFMTRSYDTLPEAEAHLAEIKGGEK